MARPRHPTKEIEAVIQEAEALEWSLEISKGHAWGHLYCPQNTQDGCRISVWSTPRNAENHAKDIRRAIGRCKHCH